MYYLATARESDGWSGNYNVSVVGLRNFIKACKECKVRKFVYMSSAAILRKNKDVYSRAKLLGEKEVLKSGLNYVIFRPSLVYGRGSYSFGRLVNFLKFRMIVGSGEYLIRPIYVKDLVKYLVLGVKKRGLYNVGGCVLTFNSFAKLIVVGRFFHVPLGLVKVVVFLFGWLVGFKMETLNRSVESLDFDVSRSRKDFKFVPVEHSVALKKIV